MEAGNQRLSIEELRNWEALGYGMFIHFGMSTFEGKEVSKGDKPSTEYAPEGLDVEQWIRVARDAGMKYAVLTTKHVSGHCLWPSKYTDYNIETSGNKTDVVDAFMKACSKYCILPGLYYCSWDNHHLFGSLTPSMTKQEYAYTTQEYLEFQYNQIHELLTQYGKVAEVWIDIPMVLPRGYRHKIYNHIAELQPQAVIMMNNGVGDGTNLSINDTWPTDLVSIERFLPNSLSGYEQWHEIEGKRYYIPGEVCDPIGHEWFYTDGDNPRSDEELLGMYLVARSRGTNFLLDVGPDKNGVIPEHYIDVLMRLRENIEKIKK